MCALKHEGLHSGLFMYSHLSDPDSEMQVGTEKIIRMNNVKMSQQRYSGYMDIYYPG